MVFIHREGSRIQKPNLENLKYPESDTKEISGGNLFDKFKVVRSCGRRGIHKGSAREDVMGGGMPGGRTYRIQLQNNMAIFDLVIS